MLRFMLAAFLAMSLVGPAFSQRDAKIPDPDPEVERRAFQVADGFEVNLFAADPLLAKPIQMNFDARGRLWIASSEVYPQIKPGQVPDDKIIILEDTKGIGRADKTTIFARGLLIPTGLEPGDGGVYVANSTELLHIQETKDGKAGAVRVALSGFGTEDTHHILHTLRWSNDGLLYMNQSIYIHSHIETPHGPQHLNAGGIWAYRPRTEELSVFARGWINPWGHHFDRFGQSFVTDGAGGEGINYCVPGGYYPTAIGPHAARTLHGLNPGHPKYCGEEIVSGRHLPDDWQGNVLTNDFRGNRVCRFALKEDGAGYVAVQMPDLIRSTHPAFRPIDIKMGPDGAIYIADWYNPIIQHGEVDFRDPRRDTTHGRIWRVTAKGRKLVERPNLIGASERQLLDDLKAPEDWTRHFAKRVLADRPKEKVLGELKPWVAAIKDASPASEHDLLEALWVYQTIDVVEPNLLERLLRAHDPHVRAAAVRVLWRWADRVPNTSDLLAAAAVDDFPRVRLEAVRAFGSLPDPRSAERALMALDRPVDQWLDYSLWLTARELEPQWMPLLRRGEIPFHGNVRHLIFALQAADARGAVQTIRSLIQSRKLRGEQEADLLVLLAAAGGPADLALVLDKALASDLMRPQLFAALDQAARERKTKPAGDLHRIAPLLDSKDNATLIAAVELVGEWKLADLLAKLPGLVNSDRPLAVKRAAITAMAKIGGTTTAERFDAYMRETNAYPNDVRRMAIVAEAGVGIDSAARLAKEFCAKSPSPDDMAEIVTAFVQHKNGAATLAKAIDGMRLPADAAKVALRTMRTTGRESPELAAALTKAGGLSEQRHTLTDAEMKSMIADVRNLGDPARGETIFRRKDMICLKCHSIAGAGGQVGPDLISIGASAQIDYLIDSVLLPNKQVKENYHSIRVDTTSGLQVTGIKVRETPTQLVLRDAEDREVVIAKKDIEEQKIGGSIMPEGLVDPLTRGELVDLVRFLSELGKVGGNYAVGSARVVRRWQVLEPTREAYGLASRIGSHFATTGDSSLIWSPAYSNVAGVLPSDAAPVFEIKHVLEQSVDRVSFVRCQLEATSPGKVILKLNETNGLSAWLDGAALDLHDSNSVDLKIGVHALTFSVDWAKRKAGLRVELQDAPGSTARARVVGGK
jgi:putative heme-binding domain-containing protein